jgi:lipoprotein NlpD
MLISNTRCRSIRFSAAILFYICLISSCLSGCTSNTLAPVTDGWEQVLTTQKYHTVTREDTLYSIAWRYGLDFRQLAEFNHIASPYNLKVGQKLRLRDDIPNSEPLNNNLSENVKITPLPAQEPIQQDAKTLTQSTSAAKTTIANEIKSTSPSAASEQTQPVTESDDAAALQWVWPTNGNVIKGFSNDMGVNRGVDFAGKAGDPVMAAASGKVVYSGSGLRGYGELLIIKHNNEFLSAYAHNRKLLVKDGQMVKAGQMIAEMGDTEAQRVMLHFEIRQAGKPVDPLKFLPTRN